MLPMNAKKTNKNSPQTSQKITDKQKRNFIVDVQDIGLNTAAGLSGNDLNRAYQKALKDAEKKKGGGKVMYRKAGREVGGGMTDKEIIAHYRAVGEQGIIGKRGMKEIRNFMKTDPTKESNIKKRMKGFDKAKKKKTLSKSPDVYESKGGGKVMKYKKGGIVYKQGGGVIKANSGGQGIVDSGYTKV
tara:strand:- start:31 stop:591 length:561 start_codon:yes stop_codon:yes gene_type:complete